MRYSWNEKVKFKWEQVYSNTIDLMADLAVLGWNSELRTFPVTVFAGRRFTTQIVVDTLLPPLQIKYLVWGLYQTGLQIGRGKHARLQADMVLQGRPLGFFTYDTRRYETKLPGLSGYPTNSTLLLNGDNPVNYTSIAASSQKSDLQLSPSSILTVDHGTAFDPDDTKLKIYYEFDGVKISSSQIFTAYLDALATAAVHGHDETDAAIIAYSEDRHTSINVRRDISCTSFTWGILIRALFTVWEYGTLGYATLRDKRWEGLSFTIDYDGKPAGEGLILYNPRPPHELATSR
ncbi:hypothetical protein HO133_003547 [Letharia lupina]|uniref:Uncharacterized protein n=1 Tax=Letharia lupina TaxID=560253 RepID=A0A8H6CA45_9LECA|nr:uncharacterized protein HO133_003547 [Letharia lupina]KAF6219722.1 hypothetical protein HO133_003547 [Letharia lupina]